MSPKAKKILIGGALALTLLGWRGYDALVDLGWQKHFRVNHGDNAFATAHSHINGIESFWAYAKTRLARFRGMCKHTF